MSSGEVAIIGAGLAGSLLASMLGKRGFDVAVYEKRSDPRTTEGPAGRSINLALSERGIHALRQIDLDEKVLELALPMYGRMIHEVGKDPRFAPYGKDESEFINSISRAGLNCALIDAAETTGSVKFYFDRACDGINLETGEAIIGGQPIVADTVIATDGAGSPIRQSMEALAGFSCTQEFLEHGYKELAMLPSDSGAFRIDHRSLHIWPRGEYMLIALPNPDKTFTCTLFHPYAGEFGFDALSSREKVEHLFQSKYPSAYAELPNLHQDFEANPVGKLGTLRCKPWHLEGKCLLLGDAAHALVPFYGQGMNCAFEDCVVLCELIDEIGANWAEVFGTYEERRLPDASAIQELALQNFIEMRDHTQDPKFLLKKQIEHELEQRFPGEFISKYSMVSFHRVPYRDALEKGSHFDSVIAKVCATTTSSADVDYSALMNSLRG